MSILDWVLLALVGGFAVRGFWRGMVREIFGLLALAAGLTAALALTGTASEYMQPYVSTEIVRDGVSYTAVFAAAYCATNLAGWLIQRFLLGGAPGLTNGLAGTVVGAAKGCVMLALVLFLFHLFPPSKGAEAQMKQSRLVPAVVEVTEMALRLVLQAPAPNVGTSDT